MFHNIVHWNPFHGFVAFGFAEVIMEISGKPSSSLIFS